MDGSLDALSGTSMIVLLDDSSVDLLLDWGFAGGFVGGMMLLICWGIRIRRRSCTCIHRRIVQLICRQICRWIRRRVCTRSRCWNFIRRRILLCIRRRIRRRICMRSHRSSLNVYALD